MALQPMDDGNTNKKIRSTRCLAPKLTKTQGLD